MPRPNRPRQATPRPPNNLTAGRPGPAGAIDSDATRSLQFIAAAVLLVALVLASYRPVLQAGFIWDDDDYVTANVALRSLDGLRRIWLEPGAVPQYYPLTFTSLWVDYHLWGLQPLGYHAVNVILHALNAVLLWLILRRLRLPFAWVAAAIFAVHPIQVESVAWITERKNVLSGMFALAAVLVYLRGVAPDRGASRPTFPWRSYVAVLVLFGAALLSKTVTCSLPAVLLLILWWRDGVVERRTVQMLVPFFVMGFALAAITVWMERYHVGAGGEEWSLSLLERALVAGRILWFYPTTLLWPRQLAFIYPRWSVDAGVWWQYLFLLAAAFIVAVLYAARSRLGKGPVVAYLCYAGMLFPALGFFNVFPMRYSFVADHFVYLPSIALIVLITATADVAMGLLAAERSRTLAGGAACMLLLPALGILTSRQCGIYRNQRVLWSDTLAKNPQCWMAHNNLGNVLLAGADDGGVPLAAASASAKQLGEAIAHFEQALQIRPNYPEAYSNLGHALRRAGRLEEAIQRCEAALRLRPDFAEAHNNLGNALLDSGRTDEALNHYREALRLEPDDPEVHRNIGTVLVRAGRSAEAIEHFEESVRRNPDYAEAHYDLGNALVQTHRLEAGITHFEQALQLQPGNARAHNNLGSALVENGRPREAMEQYEQAVRLDPDLAEAQSNLGRGLLAAGRYREAIPHLEQALRLQSESAETHNNLGVALAESERLPEAIEQFQRALEITPGNQDARDNLDETVAKQRALRDAAGTHNHRAD